MNITGYTPDLHSLWNSFVSFAENSSFLFDRQFMEYHSDRFTDASMLVFDNDVLAGIFPASIRNGTVYSHQGLTYGGLILKDRRNVRKQLACYHALFQHLAQAGVNNVVYKPVPAYLCRSTNEFEHFVLNMMGATVTRIDTSYTIDFISEYRIQERRRRSIKKGEKAKTEIRFDDDFQNYWDSILVPNLKDKFGAKPVHSLAEIQLLHSRFSKEIRQVNAYLNDEIVAGVTIFEFSNCAHCQYISSNDVGRESGAIDVLIQELINHYSISRRYFSLGTANNSGNDINIGLCDWKEGWGAGVYAHFHYSINTENSVILEQFFK
jgi:hypothetical protein